MSGVSITFTPEILAYARARGVQLTHGEMDSINQSLNAFTTVEDGKIRFTSSGFLDLSEAVEAMSARYGKPIEKPATSTEPVGLDLPANATATERAVAMNAAIRTRADTRKRDQASTLVRTYGNPWKTGNATHRAYVQNVAPDMASRLRQEAGERA